MEIGLSLRTRRHFGMRSMCNPPYDATAYVISDKYMCNRYTKSIHTHGASSPLFLSSCTPCSHHLLFFATKTFNIINQSWVNPSNCIQSESATIGNGRELEMRRKWGREKIRMIFSSPKVKILCGHRLHAQLERVAFWYLCSNESIQWNENKPKMRTRKGLQFRKEKTNIWVRQNGIQH